MLHRTIAAHWPAFREQLEEHGGLPEFVTAQFDAFLTCGLLEHGCLHLQCRHCGHSQLVAFSCKGRGVCNSCAGRRMVDSAVHLEANVLPEVPIRHWVCTLPWGVRALLAYDQKLCTQVLHAFVSVARRSLAKRAKVLLGLKSVRHVLTGAVAAIQRTDSALRLNVHFHVLVLDGVYVRNATSGELEFHTLPTPTRAQVAEIAERTALRLEKALRARGRSLQPDDYTDPEPLPLQLEHPALAACYDAAAKGLAVGGEHADQVALRLVHGSGQSASSSATDAPAAEIRGVNLYAKQVVDGRDRKQLERLCRYLLRPAISEQRLSQRPDGTLLLAFKKAWRDGTRGVVLTPQDLLVRLCAAIPAPYVNLVRYYGVLASASAHCTFRSMRSLIPPKEIAESGGRRSERSDGFGTLAVVLSFGQLSALFSDRATFEFELVSGMDEAINDGVSDSGVPDVRMPLVCGYLGREDGGAVVVSVLEDFKNVSAVFIAKGSKAPVVDNKHVDFGHAS